MRSFEDISAALINGQAVTPEEMEFYKQTKDAKMSKAGAFVTTPGISAASVDWSQNDPSFLPPSPAAQASSPPAASPVPAQTGKELVAEFESKGDKQPPVAPAAAPAAEPKSVAAVPEKGPYVSPAVNPKYWDTIKEDELITAALKNAEAASTEKVDPAIRAATERRLQEVADEFGEEKKSLAWQEAFNKVAEGLARMYGAASAKTTNVGGVAVPVDMSKLQFEPSDYAAKRKEAREEFTVKSQLAERGGEAATAANKEDLASRKEIARLGLTAAYENKRSAQAKLAAAADSMDKAATATERAAAQKDLDSARDLKVAGEMAVDHTKATGGLLATAEKSVSNPKANVASIVASLAPPGDEEAQKVAKENSGFFGGNTVEQISALIELHKARREAEIPRLTQDYYEQLQKARRTPAGGAALPPAASTGAAGSPVGTEKLGPDGVLRIKTKEGWKVK